MKCSKTTFLGEHLYKKLTLISYQLNKAVIKFLI